jgi:hypothetical protein
MKRFNLILVFIGIVFMSTNTVIAQSSPEEISTKFFTVLKDKGIDKAYDYLYSDKKAIEENQDIINNNKNGIVEATKTLGNYNSFEFISKDETGKSYIRYNYMLKYDKAPFKLMLTFYKPAEIWKVYEVQYSRQVDEKAPFIRQMPMKGLR